MDACMPHLYDPTLFSDPRVSSLSPTTPRVNHRPYSEKDKVSHLRLASSTAVVRPSLFSPSIPLSSIARPRPAMSFVARKNGSALAP